MYDSQEVASTIKLLAKSKNIPMKELLKNVGLGSNTMSNMRTSMPKADNLAKIADYLDCSIDYLLGRSMHHKEMYISEKENALITDFRNLNNQGQEYILQTMDMARDRYKKFDSVSNVENVD